MSEPETISEDAVDSAAAQSSDETGEAEDVDGSGSLMDVLRYLIHGAQSSSSLLTHAFGVTGGSDSDSSSDGDLHHNFWGRGLRRRQGSLAPKTPINPDTSVLDQSEFKQQILYNSGKLNPLNNRHSMALSSIPGLLCVKETGQLSRQSNMSVGQRATASAPFLPNKYAPQRLLRAREKFFCGVYNKEGDLFLSACQDSRIRIFDTANSNWRLLKKVGCKDVGWAVLDVDFSHGGNHIIYSSWSEYIHICNVRGEQEIHNSLFLAPETQSRTGVFSVRFNADDSEIVAGTSNGYIYIYDREANKRTMAIDAHDDDLSSVCFADNSSQILYSGGEDAVVKVWDRRCLQERSPVPVGQLAGHFDSITHIDSKGDARYLITNSKDQSIKLWDIRKFATAEGINATKSAVAKQDWDYRWHPYVGKVVKKKLVGDCSLMTYYGHSVVRTLIRCRFSPPFTTGQRYIYTGDGMGRVIIYDILTGKVARVLEGHTAASGLNTGHDRDVVRDVSWHPYENSLISSGWDCSVYKWECKSDIDCE